MGDYLIRRGFSRTASRKTMIGTGLTLVTLTMAAAAVAPPNLVASLTAIQNSIGTISSLLVAILTGYIVEVTGTFVPALFLAGGMALMGAISYVVVVERYEPLPVKPGAASG